MARNTLTVFLAMVLVASPVYATKLYKWVDPQGNVSYQDRPPPEGSGKVEEKSLRPDRATGTGSAAAAVAASKFPVTLYMVPKCSTCDQARAYLQKRKVPFTDIDVSEKHPEAQEEMRKKVGELYVPTLTIGSKVMKGYLESLLEGELDQAGYPKTPEKAEAEAAAAEGAAAQ